MLIHTTASHSQRIILLARNLLFNRKVFIKVLLLLLHMLVIFKNSLLHLISMQHLVCIIILAYSSRKADPATWVKWNTKHKINILTLTLTLTLHCMEIVATCHQIKGSWLLALKIWIKDQLKHYNNQTKAQFYFSFDSWYWIINSHCREAMGPLCLLYALS